MNVLRYKSAKYSIERPLHIGAALAGARPDSSSSSTRFGLPLGEAFQLRDDLLGVFGDPEATGKPAGDDLTEGKRTVLVALALDALSPEDASSSRRQPRRTSRRGAGHPASGGMIDGSGARAQVEQVIDELTERALTALDAAEIDDRARGVLRTLAAAATQRVV